MSPRRLPDEWLICESPARWREWLAEHHAGEAGVWLQIRKARAAPPGVFLSQAVEEALCYGWIDGQMFSLDAERYVLRFSPRRPGSIWSLVNRKRAEQLIVEGRMTEAGMARVREARANGRWEAAYSSRESPELPPDLAAALATDPAAAAAYAAWTNSQQLQAVTWVAQARRPETRARRIEAILEQARMGRPPG